MMCTTSCFTGECASDCLGHSAKTIVAIRILVQEKKGGLSLLCMHSSTPKSIHSSQHPPFVWKGNQGRTDLCAQDPGSLKGNTHRTDDRNQAVLRIAQLRSYLPGYSKGVVQIYGVALHSRTPERCAIFSSISRVRRAVNRP
jgi:hypothetical protein